MSRDGFVSARKGYKITGVIAPNQHLPPVGRRAASCKSPPVGPSLGFAIGRRDFIPPLRKRIHPLERRGHRPSGPPFFVFEKPAFAEREGLARPLLKPQIGGPPRGKGKLAGLMFTPQILFQTPIEPAPKQTSLNQFSEIN